MSRSCTHAVLNEVLTPDRDSEVRFKIVLRVLETNPLNGDTEVGVSRLGGHGPRTASPFFYHPFLCRRGSWLP